MNLPRLATIEAVAAALAIEPATVRRMCRAGRLPATRICGRWRVPVDAIEELIRAGGNRRLRG